MRSNLRLDLRGNEFTHDFDFRSKISPTSPSINNKSVSWAGDNLRFF